MIRTDVKGSTVLFSEMTPPRNMEAEFNHWYDSHHTPSHVEGVPGFFSAQRYKSDSGPYYLAVYELDSPHVLESKEYRSRKFTPDAATKVMLDSVQGFTRYIAEEISFQHRRSVKGEPFDADIIVAEFYAAPDEQSSELIEWYETEHSPILLECEDWLMVRHMDIIDGNPEPYSHLMLHYVREMTAMESPEIKRARETEWRQRLAAQPWFTPLSVTYRKHGDRFRKSA